MKIVSRLQLALVTVIGVAALVVSGWVGWRAFRIVRGINQPRVGILSTVKAQYATISLRVTGDISEMNQTLLRYAGSADRSNLDRFQKQSTDFKAWINDQRASLSRGKLVIVEPVTLTIDVGTLLDQIDQTFDQYVTDAQQVLAFNGPKDTGEAMERFSKVNETSLKLFALASQARAQAESVDLFLGVSTEWLPSFRRLILAAVVILGGIYIWLALSLVVFIYRRAVVPLRMKLVESGAIIEKQEKLAHFAELAAGLAHEIRNPLTAINARLFTLQKSISEGSPEFEDTMVIRAEISRLDRIVKDFLKQARPSEPNLIPMWAAPVLRDVCDLLQPEMVRRTIQLQVGPAVATRFRADPQQLKQVLINLVQNAAQSIGHDGVITLGARDAKHRLKGRPTDVVIIEVTDTGPGIPPEVQEHLFDPFFSTREGGTGLGLPISAHIIDKHGGALEFQSRVGIGTTFGIILPACENTDETEDTHH